MNVLPFDDARFAAYLRRITGAKGHASLTALVDVMPVLPLAGDRPEDAFLRDEKLLMARQDSTGAVGTFAGVQFELNDEHTLAVIDQLHIVTAPDGAYITIGPPATLGSGGTQVHPADTRVANQQGVWTKASLTGVPTAVPVFSSRSPFFFSSTEPRGPFILYRARLYVEAAMVNTSLQVNLRWREFPVPPPNR